MPDKIIQINQPMFESELDRMVSEKASEILNQMLDAEADELAGAGRYERSGERKAYRAGHDEREGAQAQGCARTSPPSLNATGVVSSPSRRH